MEQKNSKNPKVLFIAVAIATCIVIAFILSLTKPWTAFTSSSVDEALLGQSTTQNQSPGTADDFNGQIAPSTEQGRSESGDGEKAVDAPVTFSSGSFRSIDHETSGNASVVTLTDGSSFVRFEDLSGSDGPDLKVVVTKGGVDPSTMNADDYVTLGDLKATHGNQNYELPAGINLDEVGQVVIWCERFSSAFGAATLQQQS